MSFYTDRLSPLVGAKVTAVVSDPEGEFFGLSLTLPGGNRKTLWFLSDDEGNGPGSFDIEDDGHE